MPQIIRKQSEEPFVSRQGVSGLPEKRADLWGSLGNLPESLGNFWGTSGLLFQSTVILPGKSPGNFRGSRQGTSAEVRGNSRKSIERSQHCRKTLAASMGWGVGEEVTKSCPTSEQLCVRSLAWRFHAVFLLPRARAKSGWLEV